MRQRWWTGALFSACVCVSGSAAAQEVVHAVSGTVVKVDPQAKTLELKTNDGSEGQFSFVASSSVSLNFDKQIQAHAKPVASFSKLGDEVIVYYYGNNSVRTAVAVQDVGEGPWTALGGTVVDYNKHQRTMTLADNQGKKQTVHLDPGGVADTMSGMVEAGRFAPRKGDSLHLLVKQENGSSTAVFVNEA